MPNRSRIGQLLLSGQSVTASPANLFLNGVAVGGGGSSSRPNVVTLVSAPTTWTAMPATGAFFAGNIGYATYMDLSSYTGVSLVVARAGVAGTATGALVLGFRGTSFSALPASYTHVCRIPVNATNTVVTSGFVPLPAIARSGVYVALLGSGGNGTLAPTFGNITAQFM